MPGNHFINFGPSVKGESMQDGYAGDAGWIEIDEWSWDVEAETSFLKGGGSAVGKPNPQPLSISLAYCKGSPALMNRIVKGTHFPMVVLDSLKQTGDGTPQMFFRKVMQEVFITKVAIKGGEDGTVGTDIEMVFKRVGFMYRPQLDDPKNPGRLGFRRRCRVGTWVQLVNQGRISPP